MYTNEAWSGSNLSTTDHFWVVLHAVKLPENPHNPYFSPLVMAIVRHKAVLTLLSESSNPSGFFTPLSSIPFLLPSEKAKGERL